VISRVFRPCAVGHSDPVEHNTDTPAEQPEDAATLRLQLQARDADVQMLKLLVAKLNPQRSRRNRKVFGSSSERFADGAARRAACSEEMPVPEADRPPPGPTLIPLALTAPVVNGETRIELQRTGATINIVWPAAAARDCALWLRDRLQCSVSARCGFRLSRWICAPAPTPQWLASSRSSVPHDRTTRTSPPTGAPPG